MPTRLPLLRGLMIAMLTLAVSNGVAFAGPLEDASAAYQRGDYATALQLIQPLAAQGNAAAQTFLGLMHQSGLGVPKDYDEAVTWYRKAADQGDALGQTNLGLMYEEGRGVPQDYQQAVAWYRKAADQNLAEAQTSLGFMYEEGRGVPQDYQQAVAWYRKAADQNYARAQTNLGVMYEGGRGVPQDYQQAVAWYRKAADQGYASAQTNLGVMYEGGRGVPQDYQQAVAWYEKAAAQGFALAQKYLDALESFQNAKRDPNDVVAQVLNYTVFGNDEGNGDSFWYKETSGKCQYRLRISPDQSFSQGNFIDLDEIDPRNITFRYNSNGATVIMNDTATLFYTRGLNVERLQRGWSLIYSNYCSGKEKPF